MLVRSRTILLVTVLTVATATTACQPLPTGTATLSGTATAGAAPLDGAGIAAIDVADNRTVGTATTGPNGTYSITNLPAGTYRVRFSATGYTTRFSEAAQTAASAPQIALSDGSMVTDVDSNLDPESTISGKVIDGTGPVSGALIVAFDKGLGEGAAVAASGDDGSFTVRALNARTYTLEVVDPTGEHRSLVVGSTNLDPTEGTGITLDLGAAHDVGTIEVTDHWIDLSAPSGLPSTRANGINASGRVVGSAESTDGAKSVAAVTWAPVSHAVTTLPVPSGYPYSFATLVNDDGQMVGTVENSGYHVTPAVWSDPGQLPILLPTPSGYHDSVPTGLNESGLVVGTTNTTDGILHPITWDPVSHAATLLPVPPGYTGARAAGVNDTGTVVGSAFASGVPGNVPVVWDASTHQPRVLDRPEGNTNTYAIGIDAGGTVYGAALSSGYFPVKWTTVVDAPIRLAVPDGYSSVFLNSVDAGGEAVGTANITGNPGPGTRVAIWRQGSTAVQLLPSRFANGIGYGAGNGEGAYVATAGVGIAVTLHAELYLP